MASSSSREWLGDGGIEDSSVFRASSHKEHMYTGPGTSEIISVPEFKDLCSRENSQLEQLQAPIALYSSEIALFQQQVGVDGDKLKEITEACNPQSLLLTPAAPIGDKESPLKCVQRNRRATSFLEKGEFSSISYSNIFEKDRIQSRCTPVPFKEVILCVDVFHPTKQVKDQHILVLASQKLTELRDKISCPNDYFYTEDLSEDQDALKEENVSCGPANTSKSAFFFICNTFYNDMRHPESVDMSRNIISWVEVGDRMPKSSRLDRFDAEAMEQATFEMLKLRLGYPYLYCHHGNCEHLLIFRDMRLFNYKNDAPFVEDYPKLSYSSTKTKKHLCRACSVDAVWVTCDDELAPESPCFFCHNCFVKLHYTENWEKVCLFKAYRYHFPKPPALPL